MKNDYCELTQEQIHALPDRFKGFLLAPFQFNLQSNGYVSVPERTFREMIAVISEFAVQVGTVSTPPATSTPKAGAEDMPTETDKKIADAARKLSSEFFNGGIKTNMEIAGLWELVKQTDTANPPTTVAIDQEATPHWMPITAPGQVKVGTKLRFTIGDKAHNETAKLILQPGTDQEEIIYNKSRNFYLITSMSIRNEGSQKNVEFLAGSAK